MQPGNEELHKKYLEANTIHVIGKDEFVSKIINDEAPDFSFYIGKPEKHYAVLCIFRETALSGVAHNGELQKDGEYVIVHCSGDKKMKHKGDSLEDLFRFVIHGERFEDALNDGIDFIRIELW